MFATPGNYIIHVDLYDEDGAHQDAGSWNVEVRNAAPNLKATQTRTPTGVARGGIVTFRITVMNLGNALASGVFAILQLPVGMTRVAIGSTPGWTVAGPRRFQDGSEGGGRHLRLIGRAKRLPVAGHYRCC